MLKPVMTKHFITIILCLLCLLVVRPAEARLTLGVVAGSDASAGEITSAQAHSLATLLSGELHEEVVVKELSDSATLINWLDRFAMLDLALLSTKDVKASPGRFLQVGPFGEQGKVNLVARQGVAGDLLQRIASIVRESGFVPWRTVETGVPTEEQIVEEPQAFVDSEPVTAGEVTAEQVDLQQVPPMSPGRTWTPSEESVYRDILPTAESPAKSLVLGVFPDLKGLVRSSPQAEQLARYLEQVLPVPVKVREFTHAETFTEWFLRYRMVDFAVLSSAAAKANLGHEYFPVAKLLRTDRLGTESVELVVMRYGQNEEMQATLQRALLGMKQTAEGRSLLMTLNISEIFPAGDVSAQPLVADKEVEPFVEAEPPVLEVTEEPVKVRVEEFPPPVVEYAEPVEPVVPADVVVKVPPRLPDVAEQMVVVPAPEIPDALPGLPELVTVPIEPVQPEGIETVKVPDLIVRQAGPRQLDMPPLPNVVAPIVPQQVPEQPETVVTSPMLPEEVAPEPLEPLVAPVAPMTPVAPVAPALPETADAQPVEIPSVQLPAEPVGVAVPTTAPEVVIPERLTLPALEQPETTVVVEEIVPDEPETPILVPTDPEIESELVTSAEPRDVERQEDDDLQEMLTEVLTFADAVPGHEPADVEPGLTEAVFAVTDENTEVLTDEEFAAVLGEDLVAAVVAQPDIPQELRPSGVPVVRPGGSARRTTAAEDELLVASIPEPRKNVEPPALPELLPVPEPDPGVIYVVPFVSVMVPAEVNARVFDQFIDTLNQEGETLGLQFVILKEGLERVSPQWLLSRKYVTGEIYAYVEDSGCCSTDLRTKASLTYRRPNREVPTFGFEYPVKRFFDHDRSTIDVERVKLADDIAGTLSSELLKVLKN